MFVLKYEHIKQAELLGFVNTTPGLLLFKIAENEYRKAAVFYSTNGIHSGWLSYRTEQNKPEYTLDCGSPENALEFLAFIKKQNEKAIQIFI